MPEELVSFTSGGTELYGTMGLPAGRVKGAVIIAHGWSGCRMGPHRILVEMSRNLNHRGIATLRFDFRGRGDSAGDKFETDIDGMFSDTVAGVTFVTEKFGANTPVGLLGMCSGGNVVLGALEECGEVEGAVCWSTYPFQSQRETKQDVKRTGHFAVEYIKKALCRETWLKLFRGEINFRMIVDVLFGHFGDGPDGERNPRKSVRDTEVVESLKRFDGGLCFIFGGGDPEASDAHRIFREFFAGSEATAEFQEIDGANHNFYSLGWKREVIRRTGQWMEDRLL
ncbi:MAG: alpha/beta fold hydrolase [Planctomycetota bacterium]